MFDISMNCTICGRFMRSGGYYSNDHLDSWVQTWTCTQDHPKKTSA